MPCQRRETPRLDMLERGVTSGIVSLTAGAFQALPVTPFDAQGRRDAFQTQSDRPTEVPAD